MSTAIPTRTVQFDPSGTRRTAVVSQRLAGRQPLSEQAERLDALDQREFERQCGVYSRPTDLRPALITSAEVDHIQTGYTTGQGRLSVLVKVTGKRLDFWNEKVSGSESFDPITPEQRAKAEAFFAANGAGLAGAPRVAPSNPLRPKPGADALIEKSKAVLAPPVTAATAATPAPDAPAVAVPAAVSPAQPDPVATPKPAPPSATLAPAAAQIPGHDLALLVRIARATESQVAQTAALVAEVKALRADLAKLPTVAPAAGGDVYIEFLCDAVKVGADESSGEKTYKAQGPSYKKFGVKIWPEVLPELGIDADKLVFGENKLLAALRVRALMGEERIVDGKTVKAQPKKVVGLAK